MEHPGDANRRLEQQALKNVRALVDKVEGEDRAGFFSRSYAVTALAGTLLAIAAAVGVSYYMSGKRADERKAIEAKMAAYTNPNQPAAPKLPPAHLARRVKLDESMEARYQPYVSDCLAILEKRINTQYRSAAAGVEGEARVTLVIRSDGLISDVEVASASGSTAMEPSARRIIRMAEPCGVFPLPVQETADYLHLQTTFRLVAASGAQPVASFVRKS